jgi:hypothetical protein
VRIGVLSMRSFGDTEPSERVLRAARTHTLIFFGAPLIVMAAHPWGTASFVVAGCLLLCQALFLHVTIVAGLIMRGRARKAR